MLSDFGKAFRSWARTPRLTFAVVACIAISIGGVSTVLTFVYSLLLRPLPFPEASRLVMFQPDTVRVNNGSRPYLPYPTFADLRNASRSFETLDGAVVSRLVMVTSNGAERLRGEVVTPGYFKLFGQAPQLGREFTKDEYDGRGERAVLISSRLWRAHFAARDNLVGEAVATRSGPAIVVGIMPEGFLGIAEDEGTDYWIAEGQHTVPAALSDRTDPNTLVFGRLKPGVTIDAANAEVTGLLAQLQAAHPEIRGNVDGRLQPLAEKWRADLRPGLVTMLVASLFLLAIGCTNVAILLLARLVGRERELALRLSIGAGKADLLKLMVTEGAALAAFGGGMGLLLSFWLTSVFQRVAGIALPTHLPVVFGTTPLAFCAVVVVMTGMAFSVLPAMLATRIESSTALRAGSRGVASGALQGRGGRLLVIGQTALAVALLSGAMLFIRSYDKLRFLDLGYRTEHLLRYQVSLQRETYASPQAADMFYRQLALDLRSIPGVRNTAYLGPTLPPYDASELDVLLKGGEFNTPDGRLHINQHFATNDAFSILEVPLKEGRLFGPEDRRGGPAVALVSETLARRIAHKGSAVGRSLLFGTNNEATIVGVVADARWNGQRDHHPTGLNLFLSLDQFPQTSLGVLFDTSIDPRSLIDPVRRVVVARDSTAALHWIDTMDEALDFQTVGERFWTFLAAAYAATAFLLAVLGLYGILTHSVVSRSREIGIRMALGSTAGHVARLVAAQGLRLVAIGLSVGLAMVVVFGRLIQSRLYETSVTDPVALGSVTITLLVAGALIAWLPARRAARVSPLTALRSE
ncbi:MAG: ADOP family duplicated permease [Vicinamibacteria bacterium]